MRAGIDYSSGNPSERIDCVVVADAYIGPEGGQVYEINIDAVVKSSAPLTTQTTYNIEKDAPINLTGLIASESVYNLLKDVIIKEDATVEIFIEKITEAVASVSVSATPALQSIFNILKNAEIKVSTAYTLESLFNLYPDAVIYATTIPEVSIGVVKKPRFS